MFGKNGIGMYYSKHEVGIANMNNVQAFVLNLTVPKSLEQFVYNVLERGEYVLDASLDDEELGEWTAPRWAKTGDIAFFMQAQSSARYLKDTARLLNAHKGDYTQEQYDDAVEFIRHGFDIHEQYGGKIFAVARITGAPENLGYDGTFCWRSPI